MGGTVDCTRVIVSSVAIEKRVADSGNSNDPKCYTGDWLSMADS